MMILVADDDPSIRVVLKRCLSKAGHTVTAVEDGAAAQRALQETKFDVLITDINMPRVDGYELLEHVSQRHPEMIVLVMTSDASFDRIRQAFDLSAVGFLPKPFLDVDDVVGKVERIGSRSRRLDPCRGAG